MWKFRYTIITIIILLNLFSMTVFALDEQECLNGAELNPDYFLNPSSLYYSAVKDEAFGLSDKIPMDFLPENAEMILKECISNVTQDKQTTYEKAKALYDWLIDNTSYDWGGYGDYRSIYCALKDHIGTCADYNYTYMAMLRYIGLNARLVTGETAKSGGGYTGHLWVEVNIDGTVYIFDPQIEDRIRERSGLTTYYRFCKLYSDDPEAYIKDRETEWKNSVIPVYAIATNCAFYVDNKRVTVDNCETNISRDFYVKLCDMAEVLKNTSSCFSVQAGNIEKQFIISKGQAYQSVGTECQPIFTMTKEKGTSISVLTEPVKLSLIIDGVSVEVTGYILNNEPYIAVEDIDKYLIQVEAKECYGFILDAENTYQSGVTDVHEYIKSLNAKPGERVWVDVYYKANMVTR